MGGEVKASLTVVGQAGVLDQRAGGVEAGRVAGLGQDRGGVTAGDRRGKVRLNHFGNRTVNTALHMIAVTQTRGVGPGQSYVEHLMALGRTRTEAVR